MGCESPRYQPGGFYLPLILSRLLQAGPRYLLFACCRRFTQAYPPPTSPSAPLLLTCLAVPRTSDWRRNPPAHTYRLTSAQTGGDYQNTKLPPSRLPIANLLRNNRTSQRTVSHPRNVDREKRKKKQPAVLPSLVRYQSSILSRPALSSFALRSVFPPAAASPHLPSLPQGTPRPPKPQPTWLLEAGGFCTAQHSLSSAFFVIANINPTRITSHSLRIFTACIPL